MGFQIHLDHSIAASWLTVEIGRIMSCGFVGSKWTLCLLALLEEQSGNMMSMINNSRLNSNKCMIHGLCSSLLRGHIKGCCLFVQQLWRVCLEGSYCYIYGKHLYILFAHSGTKVENLVRCLNSWVMFTMFIDLGKHRIKRRFTTILGYLRTTQSIFTKNGGGWDH